MDVHKGHRERGRFSVMVDLNYVLRCRAATTRMTSQLMHLSPEALQGLIQIHASNKVNASISHLANISEALL